MEIALLYLCYRSAIVVLFSMHSTREWKSSRFSDKLAEFRGSNLINYNTIITLINVIMIVGIN